MIEKNYEIIRRLDAIIKLLTIDVMKDKTQKEKIILLNDAGFGPKQISEIIGTSSNTVNVALSNLRKKQKGPEEISNQNQIKNIGEENGETTIW